jgi:hypothetical protein
MKKVFLSFLFCYIYTSCTFAQSFQKEISGIAMEVLVKSNSDIGVGYGDSYQMFDSTGLTKWATTFGLQYHVYSSQESNDGTVILCGRSLFSSANGKYFVVKKDSVGSTLWAKGISDSTVTLASLEGSLPFNDGVIIYGKGLVLPNIWRSFICYIDSAGNLVWGKVLNFSFNYTLKGIATSTNELIFTADNIILKIDSSGNVVWKKRIIAPNFRFNSVAESITGGYSFLMDSDTGIFAIINTDTSGLCILGSTYFTNINFTNSNDLVYMSDSSLMVFGGTAESGASICQYAFVHLDKYLIPISSSYLGISIHCNDASRISPTDTGFVAIGNEQFDDFVHIIKVDDPDLIDCAVPFQVSNTALVLNLADDTTAYTSSLFNISSFTDSSAGTQLFYRNNCGTTQLPKSYTAALEIYPNPFTDYFLVKNVAPNSEIIIRDIFGRVVPAIIDHEANQALIRFQSYHSGIYFLSVRTDREIFCIPIIKSN